MWGNESVRIFSNAGNCAEGHFSVEGRCVPCFCAGITKNCRATGRYRNRITLRFTDEDDFKGTELRQTRTKLLARGAPFAAQ